MTENKQITIYDLLPRLKPGCVAMDKDDEWFWFDFKPNHNDFMWGTNVKVDDECISLSKLFNIAPFDGDWKDSLMECGK